MVRDLYEHLPVKDGLAAERTVLAAERTFLAYMRSAFAIFITGLTGSRLLTDHILVGTSYVLAVVSLGVFAVGIWRFARSRRETSAMLRRLMEEIERGQASS